MLILQGVVRLARFDSNGFLFFNATRQGFWRSFAAALVCLPVWVLAEALHLSAVPADQAGHFVLRQALAFIVSWLAYPLIVLKIADSFGAWPNYYRYMVAYNWFQPVIQLAWVPLLLLDAFPDGIDRAMPAVFWMIVQGVGLAYSWFLARRGLEVTPMTATALVLIDFLLGLLIDQAATL